MFWCRNLPIVIPLKVIQLYSPQPWIVAISGRSGVTLQYLAILTVFDDLMNPLITIAISRGYLTPKNEIEFPQERNGRIHI